MQLTLRQLEVFVTVAERGTIITAASALHMTQSAASAALAELERKLSVQLFERQGRRLQLNDDGRWMLPQAKQLLQQAQTLELGIKQRDPMAGSLKIGASQTIADCVLPALVAQFYRAHPSVQLSIDAGNSQDIQKAVQDHRLDIGLVEGDLITTSLAHHPWITDELVIVAAANHPWAGQTLTQTQLGQASWALREQGSGTRAIFERAMHQAGVKLDIQLSIAHPASLLALIGSSELLSCSSRLRVEPLVAAGSHCILASQLSFVRQFSILHASNQPSPRKDAFLALLR